MSPPPAPSILDRGVIYDATQQPLARRAAFFTSIYQVPSSGIWLSAFQVGTVKHAPDSTIQLARSRDQGKNWALINFNFATQLNGIPGSLSGPALHEAAPGKLLLFATWFNRSEPARPLFDPVTQGILPSRQLIAESLDDGSTWSNWRILPTPGLTGCGATGPILSWPNGDLAFAFESFKQFDDPLPGHHSAWLTLSHDGGRSFEPAALVARDPQHHIYYWDQRLCPTQNQGEFVGLFWTHDLVKKCDLSVHVGRAQITATGLQAEPIRATAIPGQIAAPLCLADGRWLAFVVDRSGPCTMALWQSSDEGQTWPIEQRLIIYTHNEQAAVAAGGVPIDFNQYWEDMGKWSFGHPALASSTADEVLCVFYAGTPQCLSIHWARVRV